MYSEDDPILKIARDATRVKQNIYRNDRTIGPRTSGNLPLPQAESKDTRESWLMSHISDVLPVLGEGRALAAGHEAARQGHPLLGAGMAMAAMLPMGGSLAKALGKEAEGRIARAAIQLGDGSIHWGQSHAAAIDAAVRDGALPNFRSPKFSKLLEKAKEGFVDEHGAFLSRDETTQRLRALGLKNLDGPGMTSEEMMFLSPKKREKIMVPAGKLPHYGERSYAETFPQLAAPAPTSGRIRAPKGRGAAASAIAAQPERHGLHDAADVLARFQQESGARNLPRVTAVDPEKAAHMAKLYESLPKHDPEARGAYDALNAEVEKQFQAIQDAGHTIEFTDSDPYKNSKEMIADVRDNRRLKVFKTPRPTGAISAPAIRLPDGSVHEGSSGHWGAIQAAIDSGALPPAEHPDFERLLQQSEDGFTDDSGTFLSRADAARRFDVPSGFPKGSFTSEEVNGFQGGYAPKIQFHPYMTPEQNDKFRAVHDWLAHAGEGHSFGPIGEENAYRVHASTLSPEAQRALATETRGQNSWVNFGPNAHLPVTQRPYAEQKAALWPEGFLGDYDELDTPVQYVPGAQSVARSDPRLARTEMLDNMGANADNAVAGINPTQQGPALAAPAPRPAAPSLILPASDGDVFDVSRLGSELPAGFTDERPPLKYPTARTDVSMFKDIDSRFRKTYTPNVERALADDPSAGGWYDTSQLLQAFQDHSPTGAEDFDQFMKFMGPTSSGTTVPGNIRQASKFYELWKSGQLNLDDLVNGTLTLPPGYANRRQSSINAGIRRILEQGNLDPIAQPKTYRYSNQLAGRAWGGAALDMHVGRQVGKRGLLDVGDGQLEQAVGFPQASYNMDRAISTSPQNNHYPVIEDALVKEAKRLGLPPAVYQAAGWVGGAKKTGVADARPFMSLINASLKNTATKYNHASPMEALRAFVKGQSPLWGIAGLLGGGAALGGAGADNR